jgi:death on curing protein
MDEPIWLDRLVVDAVHLDQLREHGGLQGVRDENTLESALARAKNKWAYESAPDLAALAAVYGYGLAARRVYSSLIGTLG